MGGPVKIGYDAGDICSALYAHHPAYDGNVGMQWVCLREWKRIDLVAVECWAQARVIGYEIKISRNDMRSELLNPAKRYESVRRCTQFYFAVPAGMLKPEEVKFQEPSDWSFQDYERQTCTNRDCRVGRPRRGWARKLPSCRGPRSRGKDDEGASIYLGHGKDSGERDGHTYTEIYAKTACCNVCKGYGTVGQSRVELEAPTLWVPADCGLMEISSRGCSVIKKAPKRLPKLLTGADAPSDESKNRFARHEMAQLVRHASANQDPRHRGHR